jgi:hypothetical protein
MRRRPLEILMSALGLPLCQRPGQNAELPARDEYPNLVSDRQFLAL